MIEGICQEELRSLHDESGMFMWELADYYGVSCGTIQNRMKEYGIEARPLGSNTNNRKYTIDKEFFKTWTPESAWMYGWALGDGSYTNPYYLIFKILHTDSEVLEKFKKILNSNHPIKYNEYWDKRYQKYYYSSYINFYSKELVYYLKKLSIYDVPKCYFSDFIRGFFEAEGYVNWNQGCVRTGITQNDEELLYFIQWCLQEFEVVKGGSICKDNNKCRTLHFSVNDSISLYHYMYDNCGDMFLKRKKEKFEVLMRRQGR